MVDIIYNDYGYNFRAFEILVEESEYNEYYRRILENMGEDIEYRCGYDGEGDSRPSEEEEGW